MSKILFVRSSFTWLFWLNNLYIIVGLCNIIYPFTKLEYIQMIWLGLMILPIWVKPVGRWLNMKV